MLLIPSFQSRQVEQKQTYTDNYRKKFYTWLSLYDGSHHLTALDKLDYRKHSGFTVNALVVLAST